MPERPDPRATIPAPEPEAAQAAEVSALARHGDPSLQRRKTDGRYVGPEAARSSGLQWVRASDLLTRSGIRWGDRGVNTQQVLARRIRTGMGRLNPVSRRGIARRSATSATRLAPVTAFGQQPPSASAAPGMGIVP
ncbi:MAG: hypothetical protein LBJ08_07520 [Bifidobacteriaceae bacterium]|jgi:hypothetical protein|nr:hypothetical protein [Bifidobacteriaceae bacterium]